MPAIRNRSGAMLYLRDVKRQGYSKLVEAARGHADVLGTSVDEYVSNDASASAAFGDSPRKSLRLAIRETPDVAWDSPRPMAGGRSTEVGGGRRPYRHLAGSLRRGGTNGQENDLLAPAEDEMPPHGQRHAAVPPSVHRVIALDGHVAATPLLRKTGKPVFLIEGDTDEPLVIERMYFIDWGSEKNYTFVQHNSRRPLILRAYCAAGGKSSYTAGPHAGPLFLEDVSSGQLTLRHGQKAWFRQWNPETNAVALTNPGADLWILSVKTETGGATLVKTVAGGRTEIIGGQNYSSWTPLPVKQPMFIVEDAALSASIFQLSFNPKRL